MVETRVEAGEALVLAPMPLGLGALATDGELFRLVAESVPSALLVTETTGGRILFANRSAYRFWGAEALDSLTSLQARMSASAADPELIRTLWRQRANRALCEKGLQANLLLVDGSQLRWRTVSLSDPGGRPCGELHLLDEIPTRPAAAERFRDPDDLFRLTFEKAAVGMTLVAPDYRFLRANDSFCSLVGYQHGELLELRLFDITPGTEGETEGAADARQDVEWENALKSGQETFHLDRRLFRRDGGIVWVHLSVSVVRDERGRPVYFIAMAEDITQRKIQDEELQRRTEELQALATIDPKTGLYNHRHMQETLSQRLTESKRTGQPVSLLMLDVDHFRRLNETLGHDTGDVALQAIAEAMRGALREHDIACRYGGEEFVMILAGANFPAALAAAERVRRKVQKLPPVASGADPITCSVGVATFPVHASTPQSLLKAADIAVYQAKRSGRNQVCGYEPAPFDTPPNHIQALETGLAGASLEAVKALITAIDLRDRYTGAHCQRVTRLAVELAARLGCTDSELETLRLAGPLLDVGKIGLPDTILTKPGRLTPEEWELMRQHPVWGEQLLRASALHREVLELVRWHHERIDGSGYPDGLKGEQVPLLVRVVNVADVASALMDDRPHRRAWTRPRVLQYLKQLAGTQLDGAVVAAYCDL